MQTKNITPREFAISISLMVSVLVGLALFIYNHIIDAPQVDWLLWFVIVILSGVFVYIALYNLLERFIYRKIKLIYKNIHQLKLSNFSPDQQHIDLDVDIINEVNDEVQRWANKKNKEIARLKELEHYRREFLGNVFHEIKTPVFSVQGYLHTLNDGAINDPKVSATYLNKAVRNIDRLEQIIEDLELITLKENNKLSLNKTTFIINDLIKDVFDALELQADSKDIEFGFKDFTERNFKVLADHDKIRQVLVNLINNSIKYGKEGGSIVVGLYDMGDNILVEITDDGVGIEQENLERLFERFYRVDESRYRANDNISGSGLGLSIVKHILDAHKQTINVRSQLDYGSTFGFTLEKANKKA